jgi:hypothetical protein
MSLKGYEQEQPVLKSLRKRGLNIPHLDDAYEIWNADKNGQLIFAGNQQREEFGYSLYAANFKIQSSRDFLKKVKEWFEPKTLCMQRYMTEDAKTDRLLERYTYLGGFLWSICGALDSLAWGIAVIQQVEKKGKRINPRECSFGKIKKLLLPQADPTQKLDVKKQSSLLADVFNKEFSGRDWYLEAKYHRNLQTHAPSLFDLAYRNQDGEFLPKDATESPAEIASHLQEIKDANRKGDMLQENRLRKRYLMSDPVHIWTEDLFNNCNRFIGDVFLALRKTYEPEIKRLCELID